MVLLYFNQKQPVFFILFVALSYILINFFKNFFGENFATSAYYINLCFFLPINLLIFGFLPQNKLLNKSNVFLLLAIFIQFSINEFLGRADFKINLRLFNGHIENISSLGFILFIITSVSFLIKASYSGRILCYASLFSSLNILFGMLYSNTPTALPIFFCSAAITLLISIIFDIYYSIHKDILTGLPSRYSYILSSSNFPLKYSIGVVSIDNYIQMQNIFGRRDRDMLVRMIASKITEEHTPENVFRYNEDEFVLIFKNENKKESFEHLEKIRRSVASAEFILHNRRKGIKLTVSTCVSEKKRSDANSMEVLYRIRKNLQKANEFSHNISSKV